MTVLPVRSTRTAPGGSASSPFLPTRRIRSFSTMKAELSSAAPASPVMRRAPSKSVTVPPACPDTGLVFGTSAQAMAMMNASRGFVMWAFVMVRSKQPERRDGICRAYSTRTHLFIDTPIEPAVPWRDTTLTSLVTKHPVRESTMRSIMLAAALGIGGLLAFPVMTAAQGLGTIAGVVQGFVGRGVARRHGRSRQSGADREGAQRGDRRIRAVLGHQPAGRDL